MSTETREATGRLWRTPVAEYERSVDMSTGIDHRRTGGGIGQPGIGVL
jgi:hypothetical protein